MVEAFASVRREDFLGPGPWQIVTDTVDGEGYQTTDDDNPGHLYQNILVAIDPSRNLNNGLPSWLATWMRRRLLHSDALELRDEEFEQCLRDALQRGNLGSVKSLRRERHEPTETCWLHHSGFCLSTLPVAG